MIALPSDVEAALHYLRKQSRHNTAASLAPSAPSSSAPSSTSDPSKLGPKKSAAYIAPLVLRDHIYSVIENRSEVDREIETLRRANNVRMLRLTATPEVALILTSDYCELIRSRSTPTTADALRCFEAILDSCTSVSISADALHHALGDMNLRIILRQSQRSRKRLRKGGGDTPRVAVDPDQVMQLALELGFLRERADTQSSERLVCELL